ncbi:conserved hypothetical protein, unlikely [Trypanosoma brucei gambiense DAL972]|uniref:Uncharacterized protein n=1 Tax=Trypanosoma brucei gambiense (strain MHOM/CI/86/DAL972) TaxID=679716 RepID=C9ZYQ6_TRYB9|nr:conserved hypothetical protein, unlikely [Trypanosoma brucei gambiense DAL972]CBH14555.1 conserved hypothetical protein, unlikely [Trypanosoma brucei gambiense DAL972]|eukprot:XP_011776821.1 conserved hypothetical protein, unlikely [Trypanosoma brucei gambiense DAL972]
MNVTENPVWAFLFFFSPSPNLSLINLYLSIFLSYVHEGIIAVSAYANHRATAYAFPPFLPRSNVPSIFRLSPLKINALFPPPFFKKKKENSRFFSPSFRTDAHFPACRANSEGSFSFSFCFYTFSSHLLPLPLTVTTFPN